MRWPASDRHSPLPLGYAAFRSLVVMLLFAPQTTNLIAQQSSSNGNGVSPRTGVGGHDAKPGLGNGWKTRAWVDPSGKLVNVASRIVHASPQGAFEVNLACADTGLNDLYVISLQNNQNLSNSCKNTGFSVDQKKFNSALLTCGLTSDGRGYDFTLFGDNGKVTSLPGEAVRATSHAMPSASPEDQAAKAALGEALGQFGDMLSALTRGVASTAISSGGGLVIDDVVKGSSIRLELVNKDATTSTIDMSLNDPVLAGYEKKCLLVSPSAPPPAAIAKPETRPDVVRDVPKIYSGPTQLGIPGGTQLVIASVRTDAGSPGLLSTVLMAPVELSALNNTYPSVGGAKLPVGTLIYLRCSVSTASNGRLSWSLGLDHGRIEHKVFPLASATQVIQKPMKTSGPDTALVGKACTESQSPAFGVLERVTFTLTSDAPIP